MIKIEFDLPEFEKELNISVTLKKDGEVITTTSSSSKEIKTDVSNTVWKQKPEEEIVKPKSIKGGNLMDISF